MMGLGKPKLHVCTKFEVATFSRCRKTKAQPRNFWSSPSPGPQHFSSGGDDDGPWLTPDACRICYGNIREFVLKRQIRFFEPPFGEVRGNVLTSSVGHWKARSQPHIRYN